MIKESKEVAPIDLVIKIIVGISIALMIVLLASFAIAFEEARDFLVPILVEVIGGIIATVSLPFLWRFTEPIIISYFSQGKIDKQIADVLPKKKAIKKNRRAIRKAVVPGEKSRKPQ